jgi:uncharacterized membrane protein
VLADIALRSLAPAINDPTTAVQALDHVDGLLRVMMRRDPEVGTVNAPDGQTRVLLRLPTWEDCVGVALDETIAMIDRSLQVRRRVDRLARRARSDRAAGRRESLQARMERA